MATPTLVATAGDADANTYATLVEANAYISARLHVSTWEEAINDDKNRALLWATSLLDDLVGWAGLKGGTTQALRWPRTSVWDIDGQSVTSTAIPQFLKDATSEFAFHLLSEDRTLETNRDMMGFESMQVGPLSVKIDRYTKKPVLPTSVQTIIRDYSISSPRSSKTLVRM
jgi:hypothetical protein